MYTTEYSLLIMLLGYTFYRSFLAMLLLSPSFIFLIKRKKKQLVKKRRQQLQAEFKEAISAVSAGLGAGYSIENAFVEAYKDMEGIYGEKGLITRELMYIKRQLSMNQTLEQALYDFAKRSDMEDILDFTEVFTAAKRNSGDLIGIMHRNVTIINGKADVEREIVTLISAKQLEQKIMNVIPFFIILYIGQGSDSLLNVLYHNPAGIGIMTCCLCFYLLAIYISERIVDIKV